VESPILQEFSFSLVTDCHLLVQDLADQKSVPLDEVISLAAIAEALFNSTTLESRTLGSVDKCYQLWSEAAGLFDRLVTVWADVDSADSNIHWLRGRLAHYHELAIDRVDLFSITESDRREHAKCRETEMSSETETEPVAEFTALETASIERAYRRL
jgi:hypothetical protein